jgi:hypothetical protein
LCAFTLLITLLILEWIVGLPPLPSIHGVPLFGWKKETPLFAFSKYQISGGLGNHLLQVPAIHRLAGKAIIMHDGV